jgi:hypothetical protein
MPFIGNKPSAIPLTSADITDGIITSAKIVDGTIVNADINASAAIAGTKLTGAGKVLQVVQTVKTNTFTLNSTTKTAVTGLSASITPSSASNKVLVSIVFGVGGDDPTSNSDFYLFKNGSEVTAAIGDASGSEQRSACHVDPTSARAVYSNTINYLDSPATTSSTTYQLYMRTQSGNPFYINRTSAQDGNTGRTISTITLTEIAG